MTDDTLHAMNFPTGEPCRDCGTAPSTLHLDGCDVARCAVTGEQRLLTCGESGGRDHGDCAYEPGTDCRTAWSGLWPGVAECREYGLLTEMKVKGRTMVMEDLNRLAREGTWDREGQRFVIR